MAGSLRATPVVVENKPAAEKNGSGRQTGEDALSEPDQQQHNGAGG